MVGVPKHRLGVALLIPQPAATEIDALRRALGDPALDRIPPHLTLVPPVNVRADALDKALAVLRKAAAATNGPLVLELGPVMTFMPVNPVLYLGVGGDVDRVQELRDRVFEPPLQRELTWPFVPHVTIADDADPDRIEPALVAMSGYSATIEIDRVTVLEEGPGRVWTPIADAAFGPPVVVGRGGLPIELSVTDEVDPVARRSVTPSRIVVTARRAGEVVGVAEGAIEDGEPVVLSLVVAPGHRGQGIARHLVAELRSAAYAKGTEE